MKAGTRRFWRIAAAFAALSLALYVALLGWIWARQDNLLFQPSVLPADHVFAPQPDVAEVTVDVPGARLSTLQLRLPQPRGVVYFLHGNAGNLASWFRDASLYRAANVDLVMLDYRGYGKSTGHIGGEQQLRDDVRAVWAHTAPRYAGKPVVLLGQSLGTGLASGLALELQAQGRAPDLTVLVSPYTSMASLARQYYAWVPGFLLRYPLRSDTSVAQLKSPVLLVHGERDRLIPIAHSEALARAAPQATLVRIPDAGHNDLYRSALYQRTLSDALAALR